MRERGRSLMRPSTTTGGRTVSANSAAMFSSSSPAARARSTQRCSAERSAFTRPAAAAATVARDERADAAPALDEALEVELAVGLEHRVRVDREAADDLLHRRKLVARPQDPEPDRLADLLHELEIGRHAGTRSRWNSITSPLYLVN